MKRVHWSPTLRRFATMTVAALAVMPLVSHAQRPDADVRLAPQGRHSVLEKYGKLPLGFEANQGQTDRQVKYLSRGPGYVLFLTSTEAVVVSKSLPSVPKADRTTPTIVPHDGGNSTNGVAHGTRRR